MSIRKFRSFGLVIAGVFLGVGVSAVAQRGNPLPLEELRQFSSIFGAIKANYVEEIDDRTLINHAISGMVSNLDPHSAFLDKDAFANIKMSTHGEFGGLGIEVSAENGFIKIISPIEDAPAARAGVMAGDLIVKIWNTPTKDLTLNEAVKLMRGKPQTKIKLTIVRGTETLPRVISIMREIIKVRSVRSKMLDNNIGYIRVTQFQEKTGADLICHLDELGAKGAPHGLILDLRNNPGGLLAGAISVAGAFLPSETLIVSTDGRTASSRHKYLASSSGYARDLKVLPDWTREVPMVVLINAGSASASEIVAGALQDYKRAKVMGNRSFGKGSVQVILPLTEEAAIKLTTSRYFTPHKRSIQATGIVPDLVITDTEQGDLFHLPREADLQRHLSNQQTSNEIKSLSDAVVSDNIKMFEFGGTDDFQLKQAINQLEGNLTENSESDPTILEDQKLRVQLNLPELSLH